MKRLFYGFLILASGMSIVSCNNGDYDTNPDRDNSDKINPLNPKGGVHTGFDWGGQAPLSMELNGNFWKADVGTYVPSFTLPGDPTEYVIVSGMKNAQDPKTQVSLLLEKSVVSEGAEIDISWTKSGKSAGNYITNVDSATMGVIDPFLYNYGTGLSQYGRVKILEYTPTHIKGLFYFMGRNPKPEGYYVNLQKGYFDINL